MKELLKKLLVIAIVAAMSFAIVGCGNDEPAGSIATEDEKDEKDTEKDTEKDEKTKPAKEDKEEEEEVANPEEAFENCMSAFLEADFVAAAKYMTEDGEAELEEVAEEMLAGFEEFSEIGAEIGLDEETMEDYMATLYAAVLVSMEYEVTDSDIDDDEATVEYILKTPDFENLEIDEDDMMVAIGLDSEEALMELAAEGLGVSVDEVEEAVADMSEEELIQVLIDPMMTKIIDYVAEVILDAEKVETESVATLVLEDDQWLVSSIG